MEVLQKTLRTTATQCVACQKKTPEKGIANRLIRTLPENVIFDGELKIVECCDCGLKYLNPMPHPEAMQRIYDFDVYPDSTNNNPVLMEHFYEKVKTFHPNVKSVLEIGCGTGDFLGWLQGKGLEVAGVEFADSQHRLKYTGKFYPGTMETVQIEEKYDVVFLLNVIEHLADPKRVLEKIAKILNPGGVLLLRHPNADLFSYKPYLYTVELGKYGLHRILRALGKNTPFTVAGFQCQHLFYFGKQSVTNMLEKAGFKVADFSTTDPYNRLRISKSLKRGNVIEAGIAGLRHALGAKGLGPECLIVAKLAA